MYLARDPPKRMSEGGHQERYDDLPFNELEIKDGFDPDIVADHFPVEREPRIDTMDEPVIIENAYAGWQEGGERYPAIPEGPEEMTEDLIEAVEAGAVAVHVHPRDESGYPTVGAELLSSILDPVFDQCGEIVTLNHTWDVGPHADYITETEELLELGEGNKYCQGSVVLPAGFKSATGTYHSRSAQREGVRYLEENDVKPIYQLYDTHVINDLKHHIFDTGDSTWDPFVMNLHLGKHHSHAINQDPWAYLNWITASNNVSATMGDHDHIIGCYPGGRNWLAIYVMGLLSGANLFRIGIEDKYWKYPHKDDIISSNTEVIEMAVQIAEDLGREVITDPDEAREILGMKYTSPRN